MVFGAIPAGENLTEDPFVMYGDPIQWVDRYKYVGTTFCSTLRDIFTIHYDLKALAAQRIANVTLAAESMTGALPPKERSIVYLARIDVTIISEYDVAVDVSEANLKKIPYSESGIMSIRHRRFLLALRTLRHFVALPDTRLVHSAYLDSLDLARVALHPS
ncbi:uncharacterized protein STEHIDRAFT_163339 [Stereum hirsutum FP-91666 SS1]|uniref:Uncharacterized protein n=1 Tax=Stereum hirsutum (strain FP-91666) TaxID=721885 RepID=R7RY08_STEHR|nr:uncharacterized protein STEHIDRAFT_163339 [Stereum hirsutum FP-91666 SS1]EIM79780.1 hypothetical protein STEHIDRAFT_163339 [Stereum hirsutum FP-91666 SS1]